MHFSKPEIPSDFLPFNYYSRLNCLLLQLFVTAVRWCIAVCVDLRDTVSGFVGSVRRADLKVPASLAHLLKFPLGRR